MTHDLVGELILWVGTYVLRFLVYILYEVYFDMRDEMLDGMTNG